MWIERRQWAIGQGCFHVGALGLGNSGARGSVSFQYVYDCGSTNQRYLSNAVYQFSKASSSIEALFVSHLDDDHVSGLDRLLASVRADSVYIPYVDDIIPVLDLLEAERTGALTGSLIEASMEPEIWFGRRGVRRVVRVSGGSPPPGRPQIPEPFEGPAPRDGTLQLKFTPKLRPIRRGKSGERAELMEMLPGSSISIFVKDQIVDWVLLPYTHPAPRERRMAFRRAVREALRLKSRQRLTAARLSDALRNRDERDSLRACYEEILPGGAHRLHNRISMSLYSGPTGRNAGAKWEYHASNGPRFSLWSPWPRRSAVGWVGTGDATLKVRAVLDAWQNNYQQVSGQVSTLLLPHHGSWHNFHSQLLEHENLNICVASAGRPSSYGHPSQNVIDEILSNGKWFWHVHQDSESSLTELISE